MRLQPIIGIACALRDRRVAPSSGSGRAGDWGTFEPNNAPLAKPRSSSASLSLNVPRKPDGGFKLGAIEDFTRFFANSRSRQAFDAVEYPATAVPSA